MNSLPEFEQIGACAFFRPVGKFALPEAMQLVAQAIALARERRIPKLLVNTTRVEGIPMLNVAERYFMMREFATVASSCVQIAFVVPPEMIEDKFGVIVGRNAGLTNDVFTDEPTAIAWLNGLPSL